MTFRGTRFVTIVVISMLCSVIIFAQTLEYNEAPMLAELVQQGKLPPVEQRLPDNPEVFKPYEKIGMYGNQIRFGISGYSDMEQIQNWAGNMGLVQLDYDTKYTTVIPNVCESYEVSNGNKTFTFYLRKGMKWSDGTPFTADDIDFAVNDILLHPDMGPVPSIWTAGGKLFKFRKIDLYTVEFSFEAPYADFLFEIGDRRYIQPTFYQKAYCSQAHPKYNKNLAADLAANNLTDWRDYLLQLTGDPHLTPMRWGNPNRPSLEAWVVKEPYEGGATQVVLERNPYFWQVDAAGNQLPYIDRLIGTIYADPAGLLLGAIGGDVDFGFRKFDATANRPVLAENAPKIDAELYEVTAIGGTSVLFQLNLTHKKPELRALFNEKDFRVALSIGFDRQEVIDTVLLGVGQPWQNAPFEDSPMYHERYATQYLEFNPVQANKLLDGLGLTKRNSDGTRLFPSGEPVRFNIETTNAPAELRDQLQIMSLMWKENLGIDVRLNVQERSLMFARINNNDHDATAWDDNTSWLPGRFPTGMVPIEFDARWAIAWADWYKTGGERGEEPPEHVKERFRLYEESKSAPSFEARRDIYHQIADIAADQFENFGVSKFTSTYGLKKITLKNVRSSNPATSQYPPALQRPWTFFWDTSNGMRPGSEPEEKKKGFFDRLFFWKK